MILDDLRDQRRAARQEMLQTLDSPRYERLAAHLTKWLRRGPHRRPKRADKRARKVAPGLIRNSLRALRRAGEAIGPTSPDEDYHRLRILAKRARYVLEFHRDIYGKPAVGMIERLVRLQDLLGEHQDAVVFLDRVVAVLNERRERLGHDVIHALDPLQQDQVARAAELRGRFPETFSGIRGRRWKRLRRAL